MTIKRDILGTIVDIELTEQELTNAHIAYLEKEIEVLKAGKKEDVSPVRFKPLKRESAEHNEATSASLKSKTIMPVEQKTKEHSIARLRELADELRRLPPRNVPLRTKVITKYEGDIREAYMNGMTWDEIALIGRISRSTIDRRFHGLERTRNMAVA